ncbi:MAG: GTP pyrophosphokinase family protein [Lachnospiraceae bacterium]|nr:GTP pyrophosphokinase family protein [Lachnospiraceae bacterium]
MEIQLWRRILDPYRQAVDELVVKFNNIKKEYQDNGIYSPIEEVSGRVKRIYSILEKAQRKGVNLDNVEMIEKNIEDIAGIRVICQFVEDIEKVVDIIHNRSDLEVKNEKDYISSAKDSGYRSYHVIAFYTVETISGPKKLEVEIQIRTLAMNFWSTIEHSLQYKYKGNIPQDVRERLLSAANAVGFLDNEMSSVREEIMDAQNTNKEKAVMVSDILSNIENLYSVASKREIKKIQDEFYEIFATDDHELLRQFERQLDVLAENYKAQRVEN